MDTSLYIILVYLHIVNFLETFQTDLEYCVIWGMHGRIIHGMLSKGTETCSDLNLDWIWLFNSKLSGQVSEQIILELKQIGGIHLNDIFQSLVSGSSDTLVRALWIELCKGLEKLFGWWSGTPGPQCLEYFARHHDHCQTKVSRRTCILYNGDCRIEELRNQLSEICSVLIHEAY